MQKENSFKISREEFIAQVEKTIKKIKKLKLYARQQYTGGLLFRCNRHNITHVVLFSDKNKEKIKGGRYYCSKCKSPCIDITARFGK